MHHRVDAQRHDKAEECHTCPRPQAPPLFRQRKQKTRHGKQEDRHAQVGQLHPLPQTPMEGRAAAEESRRDEAGQHLHGRQRVGHRLLVGELGAHGVSGEFRRRQQHRRRQQDAKHRSQHEAGNGECPALALVPCGEQAVRCNTAGGVDHQRQANVEGALCVAGIGADRQQQPGQRGPTQPPAV